MRNHFLIALAGLLGAVASISGCSREPAAPAAPKHPDISGVWLGSKGSWSMARGAKPGAEPDIPYTAWALERMKGQLAGGPGPDGDFEHTTDPAFKYADPLGFPRQYQHPLKFKIVQTGDYIYQLWEWNKVWRQIPLNKPHSEDPDITWYGESVGKWEGDALVVDSVVHIARNSMSSSGFGVSIPGRSRLTSRLKTLSRIPTRGPRSTHLS